MEDYPDCEDLTESQAQLLIKIWELETAGKKATYKVLADEMATTEVNIRGIIKDLRVYKIAYLKKHSISPDNQKATKSKDGGNKKSGRRPVHYILNHSEIATFPETALILLESTTYPPVKVFRIAREAFEKHLIESYSLESGFVTTRIDQAISKQYIRVELPLFIFPTSRVNCEMPYLRLLAEKFVKI